MFLLAVPIIVWAMNRCWIYMYLEKVDNYSSSSSDSQWKFISYVHIYMCVCGERERDCFYKINVDEIGTNLAAIWTVVNTCSRNWKIELFCFLWFCSLNSNYIAHSIVIHVLILAIIFLQWQFVIYSCDELLCSNCIRKTSRDWQMKRDFDDFMYAYYVC